MARKKLTLREIFDELSKKTPVVEKYHARLQDLDNRTSVSLDKLLCTGEFMLDQASINRESSATPVVIRDEDSTVRHISRAKASAERLAAPRTK